MDCHVYIKEYSVFHDQADTSSYASYDNPDDRVIEVLFRSEKPQLIRYTVRNCVTYFARGELPSSRGRLLALFLEGAMIYLFPHFKPISILIGGNAFLFFNTVLILNAAQ